MSNNNSATWRFVPHPGYPGWGHIEPISDGNSELMKEEHGRRIVSCVNALAGIPTEWIDSYQEQGAATILHELTKVEQQRDDLLAVLLNVARMAEALKRECGMDPESPQAIRNGEYMNISYAARAAISRASRLTEQGE